MDIVERTISELIPAEYNPRYISDDAFEQLKASLQRFEAVEPIVKRYKESIRRYKVNTGLQWNEIKYTCLWCGEHFKSDSAYSKRIPVVCSHKCSGHLFAKHKKCKNCGGIFYNYQNKYFCSMKCSGEHKRNKPLSNEHRRSLSKAKKGKPIKHFVENKEEICRKISESLKGKPQPWNQGENHPNWVENDNVVYSNTWKKISQELRNEGECKRCGSAKNLEVHHIIPYRISETHDIENLVVLCKSCHRKTEHNNIKINEIVKSWDVTSLLYKLKFEDVGRGFLHE